MTSHYAGTYITLGRLLFPFCEFTKYVIVPEELK